MNGSNAADLIVRRSSFGYDETLQRLIAAIAARGATLFDVIDHAENAEQVGLELPPTSVVIFGNPVVGTPLMLVAPSLALDLPSRVLVRSDRTGAVDVVYRDPGAIAMEHGLAQDSMAGLTGLIHIVDEALRRP